MLRPVHFEGFNVFYAFLILDTVVHRCQKGLRRLELGFHHPQLVVESHHPHHSQLEAEVQHHRHHLEAEVQHHLLLLGLFHL